MSLLTDQATKTLTSTKALVALGLLALFSGGLLFAILSFIEPIGNNSSGSAPIAINSCRTITTSGSYILKQNLTAPYNNTCLFISANNVTIDGNSKTITINKSSPASEIYAVEVQDIGGSRAWHNITVKSLNSNAGVRIYSDTANHITLDHLRVWEILNLGGDDVTISNNIVGAGGIHVDGADLDTWAPLRAAVRGNTVTGSADTRAILVELRVADIHPCPRLDAVFDRNVIIGTDGHPAVRIKCATHTRFTNNNISTTGQSIGLFLRDESDDGWFENNTVITSTNSPALWLGSGDTFNTLPSRNTFRHNIFRGQAVYGLYATGAGSQNTFTDNVFYYVNNPEVGSIAGYHGNTFDHNTFYNAASGVAFNLANNSPDVSGPTPDTFTNNIFSYSSGPVFSYSSWRISQYAGDYNLFNNRGGTLSFGTVNGVTIPTLAQWRNATGDDTHSIETNITNLLVNPASGNYSLQPTSSAYNLAHNKASDGTDIGARQ